MVKLDAPQSLGSNISSIFYDTCHPGIIRGACLKVLTIFLDHELHTHSKRGSLGFKTYLLALLISIATVYTPAVVLGIPPLDNNSASVLQRWTWIRLFAELS